MPRAPGLRSLASGAETHPRASLFSPRLPDGLLELPRWDRNRCAEACNRSFNLHCHAPPAGPPSSGRLARSLMMQAGSTVTSGQCDAPRHSERHLQEEYSSMRQADHRPFIPLFLPQEPCLRAPGTPNGSRASTSKHGMSRYEKRQCSLTGINVLENLTKPKQVVVWPIIPWWMLGHAVSP